MKKMNVQELKKKLLNKEISFEDLCNMMNENGYYQILDDCYDNPQLIIDIKKDNKVVFTATDTDCAEIKVLFDIAIDNGPDEAKEAFILKVTDIQKF